MLLRTSLKSSAQLNTSSIKNKHTSFSIYKRISPSPQCFILASALNHGLNLHFISCYSVFCGSQTKIPGEKKRTIEDPRRLWFTTGEKCGVLCNRSPLPRLGMESTTDRTEGIKFRGSGAKSFSSPLQVKTVEGNLSSSSVIEPCRDSAVSNGVFLCRAILQPKRKSN